MGIGNLATAVRDFLGRVFTRPEPELLAQPADTMAVQAAGNDPFAALSGLRNRDSIRDRQTLTNILGNVTPQGLVSIFGEADAGYLGKQIELALLLEERDPHLASLMQIRRSRVACLEWNLSPGNDDEGSHKALEMCSEWWEEIDPEALVYCLMGAVLAQYKIFRVIWDTSEQINGLPYWRPVGVREIDARRMVWPQTDVGSVSPHVPRLMINWNPNDCEDLHPGLHIVHEYRTLRGQPGRMALIRAVAAPWVIKYFALIDFANLVEKWGRPFPIVKYPAGMSAGDVDLLAAKLSKSLAEGAILVPENSSAEVSSATAHVTSLPQEALIKKMEELQSKAILGNTTQTDAAPNNESVSSPVHGNIGEVVLRNADAMATTRTLRRDLIMPWFEWNRPHFGPNAAAPVLRPNLEAKPDPEKRSAVFAAARNQLRLRLCSEQVYRELSLEMPPDTPPVLEPDAALAAPAASDGLPVMSDQMKAAEQSGQGDTNGQGDMGTGGQGDAEDQGESA